VNYTQNQHGVFGSFEEGKGTMSHGTSDQAVERLLTNYKRDVDISEIFASEIKPIYYGLYRYDYVQTQMKLKRQQEFLNFSYLQDKISGNKYSLSNFVVSAYHSPERYYGEIQNRVNTLSKLAEQRNLTPVFMTITLPSEFHAYKQDREGNLIKNSKYNGTKPKEAAKILTRMFTKLRHDRSLKELSKEQRIYFRVDEPHKDGTPHTHVLMFIPKERVPRLIEAFNHLYTTKSNKIERITDDIGNSVAYVMKYVNKVLPMSMKKELSQKELYLNTWYSKHQIVRFKCSRTLAPLELYRLIHNKLSLYAVTKLYDEKVLNIYTEIDRDRIMEVFDGDELLYCRNENYNILKMGGNLRSVNSQTSDSAIGAA
jgi:hypothetical protein